MRKLFSMRALVFLAVIALLLSAAVSEGMPYASAQAGTAAPTASALGPTPTAMPLDTSNPILIGVAVAQTSNIALLGQDQVIGAQVAEAFFNQRGGVNGRAIKLVYQDAAGDPTTAINAFNTLISGNVVAIVGPTLSTQALAADPVADKAGVPVLAPSNTAAGIPQIGPFVTRVSAPVAAYAATAIDVAKSLNSNLKNVAVLYAQDDVFSSSETKTFQQGAKDRGLNVTTVQTFSVKDKDFTTQITAVLPTNPDLVIISGLAADGGNLVKQLRELGYTGLMIGGNGLNTANIFPVCQDKCDGLLIAQAYDPTFDSPVNKVFVQAYQLAQNKPQPSQLTVQTFSSIQIVVNALSSLDTKSKIAGVQLADLRKALKDEIQGGSFDTPLGTISWTKTTKTNGDPAGGEVVQKHFAVAQIKMNSDGQTGVFTYVKMTDTK